LNFIDEEEVAEGKIDSTNLADLVTDGGLVRFDLRDLRRIHDVFGRDN